MKLNTIYNEDCLVGMKRMPSGSVDLTVTSPPYDNLRSYNGNNEAWSDTVWKAVIKELHRVTAEGGIVVWVIADATIKGSETGSSFRQALHFIDVGFNLHDTMIWNKQNCSAVGSMKRYENTFEYMFVFSKGKLKTANIIKDKPNKRAGEIQNGSIRERDGSVKKTSNYGKKAIEKFGRRSNVWENLPVKSSKERTGHPAQFPVSLAEDHIMSWSNENDIVLDCFMGSGTTAIACLNTDRQYIGFELDEDYYNLAQDRIKNHEQQPRP